MMLSEATHTPSIQIFYKATLSKGGFFFVFHERVNFLLSAMIKATAKMNEITSLIRETQSIVTIL